MKNKISIAIIIVLLGAVGFLSYKVVQNPKSLNSDLSQNQRPVGLGSGQGNGIGQIQGGIGNGPTQSRQNCLSDVWVRCGEFILQNGKLKGLSGISTPAKINYPNHLSFYDINEMSYETPRSGSLYLKDIKTIFPLNVQKVVLAFDNINTINRLSKKIESTALSSLKQ